MLSTATINDESRTPSIGTGKCFWSPATERRCSLGSRPTQPDYNISLCGLYLAGGPSIEAGQTINRYEVVPSAAASDLSHLSIVALRSVHKSFRRQLAPITGSRLPITSPALAVRNAQCASWHSSTSRGRSYRTVEDDGEDWTAKLLYFIKTAGQGSDLVELPGPCEEPWSCLQHRSGSGGGCSFPRQGSPKCTAGTPHYFSEIQWRQLGGKLNLTSCDITCHYPYHVETGTIEPLPCQPFVSSRLPGC